MTRCQQQDPSAGRGALGAWSTVDDLVDAGSKNSKNHLSPEHDLEQTFSSSSSVPLWLRSDDSDNDDNNDGGGGGGGAEKKKGQSSSGEKISDSVRRVSVVSSRRLSISKPPSILEENGGDDGDGDDGDGDDGDDGDGDGGDWGGRARKAKDGNDDGGSASGSPSEYDKSDGVSSDGFAPSDQSVRGIFGQCLGLANMKLNEPLLFSSFFPVHVVIAAARS